MQGSPSSYNLFEFQTLEDIFLPIRNAPRVKYTCFDVSNNFIILGATSGSLYIFCRDTLHHLKVVPNKEGPITHVSLSPSEQYAAFATSKGTVVVLQQNVDDGCRVRTVGRVGASTFQPRTVLTSQDHRGSSVTALKWGSSSSRLFIGDDTGMVTAVYVATKKTQALFQTQSSTIVRLNSKIVQIDCYCDKLLISTMTGCYLCDTAKEVYSQIGSKPRDGEFGACFFANVNNQVPVIYAARPGTRLWEVDFDGNVLCTHQLKTALLKAQESRVSIIDGFNSEVSSVRSTPQTLNFNKLLVIGEQFLLTCVKAKLIIFKTSSMEPLLWTELSEEITDVRVYSSDVYISHGEGQLRCFHLLQVERGIHRLLLDSRWELCAKLCIFYSSYVSVAKARKWLPKSVLQDLASHLLMARMEELATKITELLPALETSTACEGSFGKETTSSGGGGGGGYRLSSGIYVVNNPKHILRNGQLMTTQYLQRLSSGMARCASAEVNAEKSLVEDSFCGGASKAMDGVLQGKLTNCDVDAVQLERTLKPIYSNSREVPLYLPYLSTASWDVDASYGHLALASLKPNMSLQEIKNSLSSTYKLGKKRILDTVGILENRLKHMSADDYIEPLDVQCNGMATKEMHNDVDSAECLPDESIVFPANKMEQQQMEARPSFTKHCAAPVADINVTPLLDATRQTWQLLQDPYVICDLAKVTDTLEKWVDVLNVTQESWYNALISQQDETMKQDLKEKRGKSCSCRSSPSKSGDVNVLRRCSESCPSLRHNNWPDSTVEDSHVANAQMSDNDGEKNCMSMRQDSSSDDHITDDATADETESDTSIEKGLTCNQVTISEFTLEDILWLQGALFQAKTSKSDITAVPSEEGSCWLCNPKFVAGNPWQLTSDRDIIEKLVSMCLRTNTFGHITAYCRLHASWTAFADLNGEQPVMLEVERETVGVSKEDVVYDNARSIFMQQYFGFLKPEAAFHDLRWERRWCCRSWETALRGLSVACSPHCEKQPVNVFLQFLRDRIRDPALIVEKLRECLDSVTFRDVLYLDRILECRPSLLLTFVNTLWTADAPCSMVCLPDQSPTRRCSVVEEACKDATVHSTLVQLMLQDGPRTADGDVLCSKCGKPKPFSHLHPWKWNERLVFILNLASAHSNLFLSMCQEWRFWIGQIHLYHKLGLREKMFRLMFQLSDLNIFQDVNNIHLLPQTSAEWQFVLELLKSHQLDGPFYCHMCTTEPYADRSKASGDHLKCVSVEDMATLMLRYCDVDVALPLLTKVMSDDRIPRFSSSFYRSCIQSIVIKRHQRTLAYNILEKTDAYVWSRRKNYASPEVRALLSSKKKGPSQGDVTVDQGRFLEDLHCHWGINITLESQCPVCRRPLVSLSAAATTSGISVFPCGHGYHRSCLERDYCYVCQTSPSVSNASSSNA